MKVRLVVADLYVTPGGAGDRSGIDINNAAPIGSLNTLIGRAGPGGQVLLVADQGDYRVSNFIGISRGGGDGQPVVVRGIDSDGDSMAARIVGTRPEDWEAGDPAGNELFRIGRGADHLEFRDLQIDNVGTGFRVTGDIADLHIEDVGAANVRRFFENLASGGTATIDGLTIRDVAVEGFSRNAIRLQYDTNDVVIENVFAHAGGQVGDELPAGMHLDGTVHDVVLKRVTVEGVRSVSGGYLNGDGFATERGVYNIRFVDTVARGNSDGGYDLKSDNTVLTGALSEENGRNYRLWGGATLIDSVGLNPVWRGGISEQNQLWLDTDATVTVVDSVFRDAGSRTKVISSSGRLLLQDVEIVYSELATPLTRESLEHIGGLGTLTETVVADQGPSSPGADTFVPVSPLPPDPAADVMTGTSGSDTFVVDHAGDRIVDAGSGVDRVETTLASYTLPAGIEELVRRGEGDFAGSGNASGNRLIGGAGQDSLAGGNGEDRLEGGGADDALLGGWQSDILRGGSGADRLVGDVEWINGLGASDVLDGGDGNDLLMGDAANIYASGKGGGDRLAGGTGDDILIGDADIMNDSARGGADTLDGGPGNDRVYGDARSWTGGVTGGNDRLNGGEGNDKLFGGGGADRFVFDPGSGSDEIADFSSGEGDRIDLSAFDVGYEDLDFARVGDGIRIGRGGDTILVRGVESLAPGDFLFG